MVRARNDGAVRRLREESRLRIAGQDRRRSFAGWCAVATLASGISLAALDAHDAQLQAEKVARETASQPAAAERKREDRSSNDSSRVSLPASKGNRSIGDHFDCM